MKKFLSLISVFALVLTLLCCFTGCGSESSLVNHNLSQAADNFECLRKITVYNARTDMVVMYIEGYMSISNNSHDELVVTCKTGEDTYKKNYVYLNEFVIYVIEDITGTVTDPYHYKVHFYFAVPDIDLNH